MMTRRVLLGTGAVVAGGAAALGAAQITHRLDDAARLVGLEPKPEPVPRDREIVRQAASGQAVVTATVEALGSAYPAWALAPIAAICQQQLEAVGGSTASTDLAALPTDQGAALTLLRSTLRTASRERAAAAQEAYSPELVRVLASMSAGLAQCERQVAAL